MTVGSQSPQEGEEEEVFSIQRQLQICGDANHCRSLLGVRNALTLVVLWAGGGLDRFPTNTERGLLTGRLKERNTY